MLLWPLRILLGLVTLGWTLAIGRIISQRLRPRWTLGPADPPADPNVTVSVVIPARDEEGNIGACLDTVAAQDHPSLQIVVLDDGSTDRTPEILAAQAAREPRLTVMEGGEGIAEGWFGKPWALQRAQAEATGDWLVFVDADVRLHPHAVSRIVGYAIREDIDMVTGLGALGADSFWEKTLQPAVGGLILAGNDLDAVNDPEKPDKNLANGQLIAISREAYDALGGHAAVKQDILDDIGLARAVVAAGRTYRCLRTRELFYCRMYTGLGEIWEGWTKNLFAGMRYSWGNALAALVFTFLFSVLGPLLLVVALALPLGREWLWWGIVLTILLQTARALMDVLYRQPVLYGLTHAPANALVMAMIVHSAVRTSRGKVSWKGRTYKPTRDNSADTQ
ncbi:MAG: chlorobactene glucosyltransferase [Myxococcota bacterium]|jgi:chlorobactene glucosyltransferase